MHERNETPRRRERRFPRRSSAYARRAVLVAGVAAALTVAASMASGSSTEGFRTLPLRASFTVLKAAHAADAQVPQLAGSLAIAPAASEPDGNQLFVSQQVDGEVCIVDQEPASAAASGSDSTRVGGTSAGCSTAIAAEQRGGVLFQPASGSYPATAAVLVPNGTSEVDFELTDGTVERVSVANNVAWYESPQLAEVTFDVPGANGPVTVSTAAPAPAG